MANNIWTLDIESFFDKKGKYSLSHMTTVEYVKHEQFKLHGIAVKDPGGKTTFEPESRVKTVLDAIKPEDTVLAHNWAFDGLALATHYGFRHWKVADTLLLANAVLGPAIDRGRGNSLGDLAEELGLDAKGSISPLDGVRDLSPELWAYIATYGGNDADLTFQIYGLLLPRLSRPGFEQWIMRHSLDLFINKPIEVSDSHLQSASTRCAAWKKSILDKVMTAKCRGDAVYPPSVCFDPPLITEEVQLSSGKQFEELLRPLCADAGIAFPMKTVPATKVQIEKGQTADRTIPALAKKDEGFQALMACGYKPIEDLCMARTVKKSAATTMARLNRLMGSEWAHMSLTYHGACTGRWTGGGNGWNPQNIPNPDRSPTTDERAMALGIRSVLRASPGKVFVTVDAAQIECRVLAWLAGQWDVVQAFGDGADLYSDFIGGVLGETVYKPSEDDPQFDRLKALRNVGKECILGLGYGMGWFKLFARLREHPQAIEIRQALGSDLNAKFAKKLVNAFRTKYATIPELWNSLDHGFHVARKGGHTMVGSQDQVRFTSEKMFDSMHLNLPSTRRIRYAGFKKFKGKHGNPEWSYGNNRKIYGGLITENVASGIARDHLAECIYGMEHMGYDVVLTVHDSIICRVNEDRAEQCLADCIGMLSEAPAWGQGLLLGAEGHIAEDFN